jgi:murein L,D-transpeptidase YcbB/YkuD
VHEARQRSEGAVGTGPNDELDDWLGDISDDDWSEKPSERAATAYQAISDSTAVRAAPARLAAPAEAHRAVLERRHLAAGIVLVMVLGLAILIPVLLLRGGDQAAVTTVSETTATTPAPRETSPSPTPDTGSTTPPTTTTPSTGDAPSFALPEGTKLQREGEGDATLIRELQQALASAGLDPGPVDGTYGRRTEAAVVAFQQANGLSVDGRVGPETAEALNRVLERG